MSVQAHADDWFARDFGVATQAAVKATRDGDPNARDIAVVLTSINVLVRKAGDSMQDAERSVRALQLLAEKARDLTDRILAGTFDAN